MPLLAQLILHDALQPILTLILCLQVLCFLSALLLPIFLKERKKQTPTMQSLGKQKKYADKRHYSLVAKRSKEFTAYKTNCQSREEALTLHVKVRSLITIIQQSTDHSPSDTSDYTGPPYTSPSFNCSAALQYRKNVRGTQIRCSHPPIKSPTQHFNQYFSAIRNHYNSNSQ